MSNASILFELSTSFLKEIGISSTFSIAKSLKIEKSGNEEWKRHLSNSLNFLQKLNSKLASLAKNETSFWPISSVVKEAIRHKKPKSSRFPEAGTSGLMKDYILSCLLATFKKYGLPSSKSKGSVFLAVTAHLALSAWAASHDRTMKWSSGQLDFVWPLKAPLLKGFWRP